MRKRVPTKLGRVYFRRKTQGITAPSIVPLDLWLQRLSHVAQIGLLVFTVWAIFYTVIPIYQKDFLEEQISKKELELSRLENALYEKDRANFLRGFIVSASAECSGILIPISENLIEKTLAINPILCLTSVFDSTPGAVDLKQEDKAFLQRAVIITANQLEASRQKALIRYESAEATVRRNPELLQLPDNPPGKVAEIAFKNLSSDRKNLFLTQIAVSSERLAASSQYSSNVSNAIHQMRTITWPTPRR